MIKLQNVYKYYPTNSGRHYVLKDTTLTIPDNKRIGVLGENGSGKSTLMRLFAGVDAPNQGTITRTGTISWPMGLANSMHDALTGKENARFACHIQGVKGKNLIKTVQGIAKLAGIGKYFEMPARTYSSGMRARLNFAIAMAFDFDCYIIDELTAVGDKRFRKQSGEIFSKKRANSSFIKVSHNMGELKAECDMGLILHNGTAKLYPNIDQAILVYHAYLASSKPLD